MNKLKILVVDDELGIRAGIKRILSKFEVDYPFMDEAITFEVFEADTGEKAIDMIGDNYYDIILLDNKLPGIEGIEVLEHINKEKIDSKIVMITSYASLELAVKATREGAIDFVPKPFTPQELRSSIENLTKQMFLKDMTSKLQKEGKHIRFQFLSLLSHELKAPVNAVEGYLNIIKSQQNGDKISNYIPMIDRSLERLKGMKSMIMDLLDLTKIESAHNKREIKPTNISEIAKLSLSIIQPVAIQKDIDIHLNAPKEVIIDVDPNDIEIVLNNLASNAVKYNKQGGRVDCTIRQLKDHIEIIISDTGIGISEEDQGRLFEEFVRIKNEHTKTIQGSGLGLSIIKKILDFYNADIKLKSELNKGTTVTVTFNKK
jgi:two-component system, sensor histidine kinase and response regulator